MDEIAPADIHPLDSHRQIIDLGQNIAGWLKLTDLGPSGSRLRLTYAEALDESGDVTTHNIDSTANAAELSLPEAAKMPDGIGPLQVDEIISAGSKTDVFEWRITSDAQLELQVTVPPGTAAEVRLPDGRVETAEPGRWQFNSHINGNR
jgi:alpha-L-rhamnosidase